MDIAAWICFAAAAVFALRFIVLRLDARKADSPAYRASLEHRSANWLIGAVFLLGLWWLFIQLA